MNETIGMLEVCARMFEPSEDTPIGSIQISLGVETVQGSAGIVGRNYTYFITVHCHLFDSQMEMTIRNKLDPVLDCFYSSPMVVVGVASELR